MISLKPFSIFILLVVLLLTSSVAPAEAFKPGFYNIGKKQELREALRSCDNDVHIERLFPTALPPSGSSSESIIFFDKDVQKLLRPGGERRLLVIWLGKPIMWRGQKFQGLVVERLLNMVEILAYKRIIIVGAHAFGIPLLYDSLEPPEKVNYSPGGYGSGKEHGYSGYGGDFNATIDKPRDFLKGKVR